MAVGVLLVGCSKPVGSRPVCGLFAAARPVTLEGPVEHTLAVGARLSSTDVVRAEGPALLECFGGAWVLLDRGTTALSTVEETRLETENLPRRVLHGRELVSVEAPPPVVVVRYSDNRFTPKSALAPAGPTSADYFQAFFTPHGIEKLGQGGHGGDGPGPLPPPPQRVAVPHIHAGPLGEGGPTLQVTDDCVFAEADDLATAALPKGQSYFLGRAVRLLLPAGAEATLSAEGQIVKLEGPLDLRLRGPGR